MKVRYDNPKEQAWFNAAVHLAVTALFAGVAIGLTLAGAPIRWLVVALVLTVIAAFSNRLIFLLALGDRRKAKKLVRAFVTGESECRHCGMAVRGRLPWRVLYRMGWHLEYECDSWEST